MKIAFIDHTLILGRGVSTVILNLAKCLAKEHEVTIFTFHSDYKNDCGVQIQELSMPFKRNRVVNAILVFLFQNKWREIRRHLEQYDVISTFAYPANLVPLLPTKIKGPLHIFVEWSVRRVPNSPIYDKVYSNFVGKVVNNYVVKHVDRVIAPSLYIEQYVKERYGVAPDFVPLDGVDFSLFDKKSVSTKSIYEQYPALEVSPTILYVGVSTPHKNIETLIRSLKIVRSEIPETKLVVVGRVSQVPGYHRYLLKLTQDEGLQGSVIFTDTVSWEDLPKYYAACDVYATCSLWEGFLRAEAYAMEKPMVAFDITSNSETIRDGETGFLVKELTPEAFASALIPLLKNEKLRTEMGKKGYQWAKQTLDFNVIAENLETFIQESIYERGRPE